MASKGLSVVYEKCSKEQKDELVSILVETLTTGKRCECVCVDQKCVTHSFSGALSFGGIFALSEQSRK